MNALSEKVTGTDGKVVTVIRGRVSGWVKEMKIIYVYAYERKQEQSESR